MSELKDMIGKELEPSDWLEVTQERIDAFADATDDHQWIHVDPERAAEGPFGTTIAHGFLTLSLCVPLLSRALAGIPSSGMSINYGTNKVRFPAPCPWDRGSGRGSPLPQWTTCRAESRWLPLRRSSARVATSPSAWPSS